MHTCIRWPFLINRACAEIVAPDESAEKFLTLKEINILNQNDQQDKFWLIALCSVLTEVYTLAHVIYIPRAYNLRTTCIWKISDYCKLHPKKGFYVIYVTSFIFVWFLAFTNLKW